MTISDALKKYTDIEADLLLGHVLKQTKEFLYLNPDRQLTAQQKQSFERMAAKRKNGMPVAYLLGYKFFHGLNFKVNRNVLIPRPETEWLVDEALKLTKHKAKIKILDMGTGSGCIAVSIAKKARKTAKKNMSVTAADVSEKALMVARHNAKVNHAKIKFVRSNLFSNIRDKFDIIIANLPYVPATEYRKLYPNLKYEPKLALTDGSDDFLIIREFLGKAKSYLNRGGVILLEFDPKTHANLKPYKPKVYKDIKGLKRFAKIKIT